MAWPIPPTQPPNQQPCTHSTNPQSFHTLLLHHLTSITSIISTTTQLQTAHTLDRSKRLASFWSFSPVLAAKSTRPDHHHHHHRDDENDNDNEKDVEEDAKTRERKERIARLRSEGWRVQKERFGWKGDAHYEALRGVALAELGC